MHVLDAVMMLLENLNRIFAGEGQMAGIINQADILRVGQLHQMIDFVGLLNGRGHMMMVYNLHAAVICDLAQMIQALCQCLKLVVVENLLLRQRGVPLVLNREALIRGVDDVGAACLEEIHVIDKCTLVPPQRLLIQIGADPSSDYRQISAAKLLIQDSRISRELAANFGANVAGQCNFADGLQKAVLCAHLRHVIFCPRDRCNADANLFRV